MTVEFGGFGHCPKPAARASVNSPVRTPAADAPYTHDLWEALNAQIEAEHAGKSGGG